MPLLKKVLDYLRRAPWSCPLLIACAYAWGLRGVVPYLLDKMKDSGYDIGVEGDTQLLRDAVLAHPRFLDTLQWWDHPWYQSVPYFRPLSVTLFWVETKLFGTQGILAFEGMHWLMHGLLLAVLWGFFSRLAGKHRGALAVALFASGWNDTLALPTGVDAFNCWKDSVDVWSTAAMVGACWCLYNYLEKGGRRYWWGMFALWIVNISIKESGFITPFVLALVLWYSGRWRERWSCLVPVFLLMPLLWLYRMWAVGGYGNKTGTGNAWLVRFSLDGLGIPPRIVNGDLLALVPIGILAGAAGAYWMERRGQWRKALAALGAGGGFALVAYFYTAYKQEATLEDTLVRFCVAQPWLDGAFALLIIAMYLQFFRRKEKLQFFGLFWVWVNFTPLIIQPPTSPHVFYPIAPGWSLLLACAVWPALGWLQGKADGGFRGSAV